jgi:hypothetical protein
MAASRALSATAIRWTVAFVFFAPAFVWAAYQLRDSTIDVLAFALVFAILIVQLARDLYDLAHAARRAWRRVGIYVAEIRSYHLGLRSKFLALLVATAAIWIGVIVYVAIKTTNEVAFVAAIAGFTATVGWTISSYITARNTQRQNTITLLMNMRNSDVYSRHFNNAYYVALNAARRGDHGYWLDLDRCAKWKNSAGACDPTDDPQAAVTVRSAYQSVIYLLNYYEFIAAGVRSSALDAGIVRRTISGYLRYFFETFSDWIEAERKGSKIPYEHLVWYCRKFPHREPQR